MNSVLNTLHKRGDSFFMIAFAVFSRAGIGVEVTGEALCGSLLTRYNVIAFLVCIPPTLSPPSPVPPQITRVPAVKPCHSSKEDGVGLGVEDSGGDGLLPAWLPGTHPARIIQTPTTAVRRRYLPSIHYPAPFSAYFPSSYPSQASSVPAAHINQLILLHY